MEICRGILARRAQTLKIFIALIFSVTIAIKKGGSMENVVTVLQIVIALGIINVWILRPGKSTSWRGGAAKSMQEEFKVYGLPAWFMYLIGFLKCVLAALLIVGIWIPVLTMPAAIAMAAMMLGAVSMHIRVKDSLKKSLPAFTMLVLSLAVAFL